MRADTATLRGRSDMQLAALIVGAVFLLVGILGFIPGVTTNYGDMGFAGPDSEAMLLGLFQVSILHNIVHLLFGVVGIWAGLKTYEWSRNYLIWGGVIYLAFWIYGLLVGEESTANFVPFNTADNWLHFLLGAGMIAVGFALARRAPRAVTT